jgi:hypothetical protein
MDDGETKAKPGRRRSVLVLTALLGAVAGLGAAVFIWALVIRESLPELTPAEFDAAQQRWRAYGPVDYHITVEVEGRQAATYQVEVRDGQPVAAFRNGRPLTQRRTWGTWSVPGMFGTLESDFHHLEAVASGAAVETTPRLSLYGVFDPQYGYPARYRRVMWGGAGQSMAHRIGQGQVVGESADAEVSWRVVEFAVAK